LTSPTYADDRVSVQDRYAGDVGDYQKLGLLRAFASQGLRVGICWYLAPDESHNGDGRHVGYLASGNGLGASLRRCDPDLYADLFRFIAAKRRSVAALEQLDSFPASASHAARLERSMGAADRARWQRDALEALKDPDVVFCAPDNGCRVVLPTRQPEKHALLNEIGDYLARGQSVVVYQHRDRTSGHSLDRLQHHLEVLHHATGFEPLGGVLARRGSQRFFLVVAQQAHRSRLLAAIEAYERAWAGHVAFARYRTAA
jgi:hypothetical protein